MINQQIKSLIGMTMFIMVGCATTIPHQGCYVEDPRLRGQYMGECRGSQAYGWGKSIGQDTYEGEFVKGIVHGKGTYIWSDGEKYIGEFKNGQIHGRGVMIRKDGSRKEGVWENHRLVKSLY